MSRQKNTTKPPIFVYVGYFLVATLLFTGVTFSGYITVTTAEDRSRVARFDIEESGVQEHYITGKASAYEKFEKFCEVFPLLAGNPVYDWSRMELREIFGIEEIPCKENAWDIYQRANALLETEHKALYVSDQVRRSMRRCKLGVSSKEEKA